VALFIQCSCPNLWKVFAEAPAVLEAYMTVDQLLSKSSLSQLEQQVVLLTASVANECHYCIPAYSMMAKQAGLSDEDLAAVKASRSMGDAKLEILREFTLDVVEKRGRVSEAGIGRFLEAGYSRQQALEVVMGVSLKTLSNYINALVDTPVDNQFKG